MKMPPFDKKKLQVIIVAVAMGLVAIFLVNKYTEQRIVSAVSEIARQQQAAAIATAKGDYDAVIALREIPRGQAIEREMLIVKKFPGEFVQPGALNLIESVVGKTAAADILPGEQITASKLGFPGSGPTVVSSLSLKVPAGKRAITIPIDTLSAAGGMVRPGDYVDIIGNFPVPAQQADGKMGAQLATVTLFQNVLVLAVSGEFASPGGIGPSRSGKGETVAPSAPPAPASSQAVQTITFALPPKEAELLLFAQEQGRLKLVLRSSLDTGTSPLPVATWDALLQYIVTSQGQQPATKEGGKMPSPSQQALEQKILEIYRAGNLEKETPTTKETPPK